MQSCEECVAIAEEDDLRRYFAGLVLFVAIGSAGCSSNEAQSAKADDSQNLLNEGVQRAFSQTDYELESAETACLAEIDARRGGAVQEILSDWPTDDVLQNLIARRKLDILLMEEIHVNKRGCSNGADLPLLTSIQSQNGTFLSAHLSLDLVASAGSVSIAQGAIDVISRHDSREGLSAELRSRLLGIYETLLGQGNLDPISYAGLVDNIQIRDHGTQTYGSYSSCVDGAWVPTYEVVDPDGLDQRRAALLKDEEWPVPPPELCSAQ